MSEPPTDTPTPPLVAFCENLIRIKLKVTATLIVAEKVATKDNLIMGTNTVFNSALVRRPHAHTAPTECSDKETAPKVYSRGVNLFTYSAAYQHRERCAKSDR